VAQVEDLVNAQVLSDPDVAIAEMSRAEADAAGAIAFFDEKYGERVRVISAGPLSTELCGGTHVARLGQIGPVEIVSESSIGSNLRRVEATTGTATLARLRANERTIADAAGLLRARPDELTAAIQRKLADLRTAEVALRGAQQAALAGTARTLAGQASDGKLVARADGLAGDQLSELAAQVRAIDGVHTVVLGGTPDGHKVALVALVAKDQVAKSADLAAPALIADAARTVGGGGGGKNPERAMAGGRDPGRLDEALDSVRAKLGLSSDG
jgi:alanyl-tRNA synthetase